MFVPAHRHLIVRALVDKPPLTKLGVSIFLIDVVDKVGMTVINGPHVSYVTDKGNEGATGVVILAESHCAMHVWDRAEPAEIQFDLYSCKEFDPQDVFDLLDRFGVIQLEHKFLNRDKGINLED